MEEGKTMIQISVRRETRMFCDRAGRISDPTGDFALSRQQRGFI
jgi:hypothetical protein